MAAESLQLLFEVTRNEGVTDLDRRVIRHEPSFSAADKQAILPGFLIQKTVTILIENKFVSLQQHWRPENIAQAAGRDCRNARLSAEGA
jgi:hypothetical protein